MQAGQPKGTKPGIFCCISSCSKCSQLSVLEKKNSSLLSVLAAFVIPILVGTHVRLHSRPIRTYVVRGQVAFGDEKGHDNRYVKGKNQGI